MRGAGPIGYPGAAEVVDMRPRAFLLERGVHALPCIGGGRQSGTSGSPLILKISPKSAAGGDLAILRDGDRLRIDIGRRRVDLLLDADEVQRCRTALEAAGGSRYPRARRRGGRSSARWSASSATVRSWKVPNGSSGSTGRMGSLVTATDTVRLVAGDSYCEIAPALGGSILSLSVAGVDLLRPAPPDTSDILDVECFAMLPFANRVAQGCFTFRGRDIVIGVDPAGTPMHCTATARAAPGCSLTEAGIAPCWRATMMARDGHGRIAPNRRSY